MAKRGRGQTGKVNYTAAASSDRRSGGKSTEFGRSRPEVNRMGSSGGSTTASPISKVGGSARKEAPFNGSNVYGILTRGGGASSGGGAPGGSRGNSLFGTGSAKSSGGPQAPKRTGRRGGR